MIGGGRLEQALPVDLAKALPIESRNVLKRVAHAFPTAGPAAFTVSPSSLVKPAMGTSSISRTFSDGRHSFVSRLYPSPRWAG